MSTSSDAASTAADVITAVVSAADAAVNSAAQAVSDGLWLLAANDGLSSDDEGDKVEPIDVDMQASEAERRRQQELRNKWTGKISNGKQQEQIVLPDRMIQRIEAVIKEKTSKKKGVRTSWGDDDKKPMVVVHRCLNSKYTMVAILHCLSTMKWRRRRRRRRRHGKIRYPISQSASEEEEVTKSDEWVRKIRRH